MKGCASSKLAQQVNAKYPYGIRHEASHESHVRTWKLNSTAPGKGHLPARVVQ